MSIKSLIRGHVHTVESRETLEISAPTPVTKLLLNNLVYVVSGWQNYQTRETHSYIFSVKWLFNLVQSMIDRLCHRKMKMEEFQSVFTNTSEIPENIWSANYKNVYILMLVECKFNSVMFSRSLFKKCRNHSNNNNTLLRILRFAPTLYDNRETQQNLYDVRFPLFTTITNYILKWIHMRTCGRTFDKSYYSI